MGIEKYFHKVVKPVLIEKDKYLKVLNTWLGNGEAIITKSTVRNGTQALSRKH